MGGSRALLASLGTSVVLVAAAAIALLVVSAVVAFGGWQDDVAQSAARPALVFDDASLADGGQAPQVERTGTTDQTFVISGAVQGLRRPGADLGRRPAANPVRVPDDPSHSPAAPVSSAPDLGDTPPARPSAPVQRAERRPGNGVRDLGEDLSSTVEKTGQALADATAPLAPPVSAAVQEVLNAVAELLRRGTGGVANTLDNVLAPR